MERQSNYGISGGNGRSGRVRILAAQVKASANRATWLFLGQGEMFFSTCVHEKEFLSFLKLGKCLDFLYESKEEWDRPVILSDPLGMVWLAENAYVENEGETVQTEQKKKEKSDRTVVFESYVGQTYRGVSAEFVVFGSYAQRDDADACGSACDLDVCGEPVCKNPALYADLTADPDVGFYFPE